MTTYLVATLARYVLVDAESESEARRLGQPALYDLYADLRVVDGRLQVAEADEAITQGIDWIVADHADRILAAASEVPEVGLVPYLRATVTGLIAGDRRISSVDQVTITRDPATASITMDVVATAINGATVDTAQVVR